MLQNALSSLPCCPVSQWWPAFHSLAILLVIALTSQVPQVRRLQPRFVRCTHGLVPGFRGAHISRRLLRPRALRGRSIIGLNAYSAFSQILFLLAQGSVIPRNFCPGILFKWHVSCTSVPRRVCWGFRSPIHFSLLVAVTELCFTDVPPFGISTSSIVIANPPARGASPLSFACRPLRSLVSPERFWSCAPSLLHLRCLPLHFCWVLLSQCHLIQQRL